MWGFTAKWKARRWPPGGLLSLRRPFVWFTAKWKARRWPLWKKSILDDGENFTFLGRNVEFKGVVNFDGTARIDGRLEGEIHTKGTLIVAEHAVIKGIISAGTLISGGKIYGTISASERVQLLKPAVLIGDVRTPSFSTEDGAHFHGMCDMGAKGRVEAEPQTFDKVEKVHDLTALRGRIRQDA